MKCVLVTEPLAHEALVLLREEVQVDVREGLAQAQLAEIIEGYEGLIVRSATRVTEALIRTGKRLQVIGRAGIGVDNIDLDAATRRGIVVVNAPAGNTIAVAEHTIGLMLSLARHIPQADAMLRAGRWEKKNLTGVEVRGRILGVIGLGQIGTAVARRAIGLEMEVIAHDPFVSVDRAAREGVRLVTLEELLRTADFISIHAPLTDRTRGMIDAQALTLVKPTARLINCARGGIVDEAALVEALESGRLAGAALDVFEHEPLTDSPLLRNGRVILTPHLGAATEEAQLSVALEIAKQVLDVLNGLPPHYPVNAPFLASEELEELGPYIDLAQRLGSFYAQVAGNNLVRLEMTYGGDVAERNTELLRAALLVGLLSSISEEPLNLVNATVIAQSRGLMLVEHKTPQAENFAGLITLRASTTQGERVLAGTVMRGEPHIVCIDEYWLDFVAEGLLLVSEHIEQPGIIGRMGTLLGNAGINISFVQVGRRQRGGPGVMVLGIDDPLSPEVLAQVHN
ncbi:MAG: phosphoglycerate dehydrogenase, partial [Candidatus Zipacnadales bacterium]